MPAEDSDQPVPSTLGVVLHVMERNFDTLNDRIAEARQDLSTQIQEARSAVGNLRQDVGVLSGQISTHIATHASSNGDAKALARAVGFVKDNWKIIALAGAMLGIGSGSTYVIPGCGKTVHIHDGPAAAPAPAPAGASGTPPAP